MADDELLKMQRDADMFAWFVLLRRLFTEVARTREDGWLREQARLAETELRALRPKVPGKAFNPATIDMAAGTITEILSGIVIHRPPKGPLP